MGYALCHPLRCGSSTMSIAITQNGTRIVSGSMDGAIRMWDAETHKALGAPLQGHTTCVWSVAISPNGLRIVTNSDDNSIRGCDMATGGALGAPLQGRICSAQAELATGHHSEEQSNAISVENQAFYSKPKLTDTNCRRPEEPSFSV
jgi:WD40 repeat protein